MEALKGTQWILQILQCVGCFAVTDGDIVLAPTNSNFNKRGPCTLFFPPNIVSITISCNVSKVVQWTETKLSKLTFPFSHRIENYQVVGVSAQPI